MRRPSLALVAILLAVTLPVTAQSPTDGDRYETPANDKDSAPATARRARDDDERDAGSRRSLGKTESPARANPGPADDTERTTSAGEMKKLGDRPERPSVTRVTSGPAKLPGDQGQIWREYDISPYTTRVTTTKRPQQAIVDWILRETGYESWHAETIAVLNADNRTLRVYHTPEVQRTVGDIVDRFVSTQAESHNFTLRVVTIGSPNWRETAVRVLRPIPVQSQGIQAWVLAKEDAAVLLAQLSRRSDFREYTSPNMIVHNGQPTVVGASRARQYAKSVLSRPGSVFGIEMEMGQIDEGYSLEFSPLLSLDGKVVDAIVKCQINQIEKMIPVTLDVPMPAGVQRPTIEVPQLSSCDLHERFRWPTEQVLLVSRGVVATPTPKGTSLLPIALPGVPSGNRADALVFIQSQGKAAAAAAPSATAPATTARPTQRYHGRY